MQRNADKRFTMKSFITVVFLITVFAFWIYKSASFPKAGAETITTPCSLSSAEVTLMKTKAAYRAEKITTPAEVVINGKTLEQDKDYTISFKNNLNVGKATVTITGKGDYTGTISKSFEIIARPITNSTPVYDCEVEYTGKPLTPLSAVALSERTLICDTDYTVSYSDNVNVGIATMTISGKGNYCGEVMQTFRIVPKGIENAVIEVDSDSDTYIETVTLGETVLERGTDYSVSTSRTETELVINITGIGNYKGIASKRINVSPGVEGEFDVLIEKDGYTFTGSKIIPDITVSFGERRLTEGTDYSVQLSDNIDVGTAKINIVGSGIYAGLSETAEFTIYPASLSDCIVNCDSYPYTGANIAAIPDITYGDYTLKNKTDYVITLYENAKDVGRGSLVAVGIGNFIGKITVNFEIYAVSTTKDEDEIKARLDEMMRGDWDRKINSYTHSYKLGNYYNTLLYSPCTCHSFCMDGTEADCTCLIGRSNVLSNRGIQCAGFTFEVFEFLFGGTNSAGGNILDKKNRSGSDWTLDGIKKWAKTFRPGDYLAYTNVSYYYDHYITVYSVEDDGIWVYEANYGGRCKINFRKFTFREMYEQCDDFWHRTPTNYKLS